MQKVMGINIWVSSSLYVYISMPSKLPDEAFEALEAVLGLR
jgi:hypothetical protein